ncbi:MAG TPA: glutamate ABC transporter substrate-binding protein [Candidatus Saccharimonadales bacterium]|nr:glutamate ABC transporter substrate-binding protein [Candidatus Saccharimonadales bacterium]
MHRSLRSIAILLVTVFVAAACGGAGTPAPAASGTAAASAATKPKFELSTFQYAIQTKGKFRVGTREDNVPFGLKNPATGKFEGFDIDIARELAKGIFGPQANIDDVIEWTPVVSATRIPTLQDNKADIIIATFTINDARKKEIDFSSVYFKTGQKILVKKSENSITKVEDLVSKTVCSAKGSTSETNLRAKGVTKLLLLDTYPPCLLALQNGQADAISTDETILFGLVKQDPNTKIVGSYFSEEPYGIGFKKDRVGFQAWIDAELKKIIDDGRWAKIYKQWISPVSGDEKKNPEGK